MTTAANKNKNKKDASSLPLILLTQTTAAAVTLAALMLPVLPFLVGHSHDANNANANLQHIEQLTQPPLSIWPWLGARQLGG
jgi:hypothetical protein